MPSCIERKLITKRLKKFSLPVKAGFISESAWIKAARADRDTAVNFTPRFQRLVEQIIDHQLFNVG